MKRVDVGNASEALIVSAWKVKTLLGLGPRLSALERALGTEGFSFFLLEALAYNAWHGDREGFGLVHLQYTDINVCLKLSIVYVSQFGKKKRALWWALGDNDIPNDVSARLAQEGLFADATRRSL